MCFVLQLRSIILNKRGNLIMSVCMFILGEGGGRKGRKEYGEGGGEERGE